MRRDNRVGRDSTLGTELAERATVLRARPSNVTTWTHTDIVGTTFTVRRDAATLTDRRTGPTFTITKFARRRGWKREFALGVVSHDVVHP